MPSMIRRTWYPTSGEPFLFDAYLPGPIAALELRLSAAVAAEIERAAVAVSELQLEASLTGLEAASRQLLRSEALASSRIEGLEMDHERIATALAGAERPDEVARSVIANIEAMERAVALAVEPRPFSVADLLAIHDTLMVLPRERRYAGEPRHQQNWIGRSGLSPRDAEFIPPPEDLVPGLLDDLAAFVGRTDISPVARAAIAHAQLETILPFVDGNGRVGRALIHVVLRRGGVAPRLVPPISVILATNRARYVDGLTAFRVGDVESWLLLFAHVLEESAVASRSLGARLTEMRADWTARARPRAGSAAERLLAALPGSPVLSVRSAAKLVGVSYPAANQGIERLEAAGILVPVREDWRRNRLWSAPEVLALLDDFDAAVATPTRASEPGRPRPGPSGAGAP